MNSCIEKNNTSLVIKTNFYYLLISLQTKDAVYIGYITQRIPNKNISFVFIYEDRLQ